MACRFANGSAFEFGPPLVQTALALPFLLRATVNCTFSATENCTAGGLRAMRPSTMRTGETHGEGDARDGDEDAAEALSGRRRVEGGTGEAAGREPPDGPRLDRVGPAGSGRGGRGGALLAAASGGAQAGPVQGDHRRAAVGVSEAVGAAAVRGGSRGGLRGRLQPREGLRPGGASAGAGGAAGPLRDASGLAGAGGLRRVPSAVGPPAGAPGGAGLLAADVDAVLSAPDDGRAVRRAGGRVRALRRRSAGCCSTRCGRWRLRTAAPTAGSWW